MRSYLQTFGILLIASLASVPATAADDWSFVAGTYAIEADDCKAAADHKPFSDELVEALSAGCPLARGDHQPARGALQVQRRREGGRRSGPSRPIARRWGKARLYDLKVTAGSDGSLSVSNEDVWGPDPQVFKLCQK